MTENSAAEDVLVNEIHAKPEMAHSENNNDIPSETNGANDSGVESHDFNGEHTKTTFKAKKNTEQQKTNGDAKNGTKPDGHKVEEVKEKPSPKKKKSEKPVVEPVVRSKRERKSVSRFSDMMDQEQQKAQDDAVEMLNKMTENAKAGSGVALNDIPHFKTIFDRKSPSLLSDLGHVIAGKRLLISQVKPICRIFNGFNFDSESQEFKKRETYLGGRSKNSLHDLSQLLDLEVGGNMTQLTERILNFLSKPDPESMKHKGEFMSKKAEKKKKKSKSTKAKSSKKTSSKTDASKTSSKADETNSSLSTDESENESDEDEEAEKDAEEKASTPSPKKQKTTEDPDFPTDEELKEKVYKFLETAEMDNTSLKTVRAEIESKYPDKNLSGKRDFLNSIVRQYLSEHDNE